MSFNKWLSNGGGTRFPYNPHWPSYPNPTVTYFATSLLVVDSVPLLSRTLHGPLSYNRVSSYCSVHRCFSYPSSQISFGDTDGVGGRVPRLSLRTLRRELKDPFDRDRPLNLVPLLSTEGDAERERDRQ